MFITATGLACPVGLTSDTACAAMRAGIAMFEELPYFDNQGQPIVGAAVPGFDPLLRRERRLVELLTTAIADCLDGAPRMKMADVPLLLGLAEESRPGGGAPYAGAILAAVQQELGISFHSRYSRAITKGHTAGYEALGVARQWLRGAEVPACLVCGVDSYINAPSLLWLDQHSRLKTAANQHGLIPGEAAAAVLLLGSPAAPPAVEILGIGFGLEKSHVMSDEPLLGLGLTEAARGALAEAKCGLHEVDWRMSDVTGEQYGFKELPLVAGRLMRVLRSEAQPLWHCSESIGDSGAAAGIVQLVAATQAFRKSYAPGHTVVCFASAVYGDRASAVLRGVYQPPVEVDVR